MLLVRAKWLIWASMKVHSKCKSFIWRVRLIETKNCLYSTPCFCDFVGCRHEFNIFITHDLYLLKKKKNFLLWNNFKQKSYRNGTDYLVIFFTANHQFVTFATFVVLFWFGFFALYTYKFVLNHGKIGYTYYTPLPWVLQHLFPKNKGILLKPWYGFQTQEIQYSYTAF